jgi:hypothetical protein
MNEIVKLMLQHLKERARILGTVRILSFMLALWRAIPPSTRI